MVRVASVLCRVPVIKFRKGGLGLGGSSASPGDKSNSAVSAAPAAAQQPNAAAMSTSSVPDIDLPLRYRRLPLSEEEIEKINGGGIRESSKSQDPQAIQARQDKQGPLSVINIPNSVLIDCKQKQKHAVSLNIVVQKVNRMQKG